MSHKIVYPAQGNNRRRRRKRETEERGRASMDRISISILILLILYMRLRCGVNSGGEGGVEGGTTKAMFERQSSPWGVFDCS